MLERRAKTINGPPALIPAFGPGDIPGVETFAGKGRGEVYAAKPQQESDTSTIGDDVGIFEK